MKKLKLSSSTEGKISSGTSILFNNDVEQFGERFTPGEWIILEGRRCYLACSNPFGRSGPVMRVSGMIDLKRWTSLETYVEDMLVKAIIKRRSLSYYEKGCRLFYGEEDGLSGLVIDAYLDVIIVNISSCGIWDQRIQIKNILIKMFSKKKIYITHSKGANSFEEIPGESEEILEDRLLVHENGFNYSLNKDVIQKAGYYYDHRNNRQRMEDFLKRNNSELSSGLDLFSYVGSWGLHLLRSGCEEVEFIDQANLEDSIQRSIELNNFTGRGTFYRSDVYKALDERITNKNKYDVVVSDPPAFTKSQAGKDAAIRGYEKLHHKSMQLINKRGIYVAASCTSHVSLSELDETVQLAAKRLNRSVTLGDIGIQGEDHMMQSLHSRSNYIKYLLYILWE